MRNVFANKIKIFVRTIFYYNHVIFIKMVKPYKCSNKIKLKLSQKQIKITQQNPQLLPRLYLWGKTLNVRPKIYKL